MIPSKGSMEIEKASHILLGHNERCVGRLIELLEQLNMSQEEADKWVKYCLRHNRPR